MELTTAGLESTTLYVDNLPRQWRGENLRHLFSKYTKVLDCFIPAKLSKRNSSFGFVRVDIKADPKQIIDSLLGYQIGSNKLFVSLAKFSRGVGKKAIVEVPKRIVEKSAAWVKKDVSFLDSLKNIRPPVVPPDRVMVEGREFLLPVSTPSWLERSLVAVLYDVKQLCNIKRDLESHGLIGAQTRCLGGDSVLITFVDKPEMEVWAPELKPYFKKLMPWYPDFVPDNRCAWLKILGVPPHVWSNDFFEWLVEPVGKLIRMSDLSEEFPRFDEALVLISTSRRDLINQCSVVKAAGKNFQISLLEIQTKMEEQVNSKGSLDGTGYKEEQCPRGKASLMSPVTAGPRVPLFLHREMMATDSFETSQVAKSSFRGLEATPPSQVHTPGNFSVEVDANRPRAMVDAVGLDVNSEVALEADLLVGEAVAQVDADVDTDVDAVDLDVFSEAVVEVQADVEAVAQRPVHPMDAWLAECVITQDGRPLTVASLPQPWVGTRDPLIPTPIRSGCRKRRLTKKAATLVKLPPRKAKVKLHKNSPSPRCLGSIINDFDVLDVELCSVLTTEAWRLAIAVGFSWEEDTSRILHAIKLAARGQFSPWNFDPP